MTILRRYAHRPTAVDIVISVLLLVIQIAAHFRLEDATPLWPTVLFPIAGSVAVLFRQLYPLPILITTLVLLTAAVAITDINGSFLAPAIVALFTVADRTDRRTTVISGAATAVALYLITLVSTPLTWDDGRNFSVLAWTALAAGVGDATRYRRNFVAAIEERARKAEAERDSEAARQVSEERLRIARELHDVLAHHIAVIHVHSGLAGATMTSAPDTSRESLGHIKKASADVLDELAALMQVLRSTDSTPTPDSGPQAPAPGLARLDELIETYRQSGTPIVTNVSGKPRALSPAADLAAFRIIQEALTNAHKHGVAGTTVLDIRYSDNSMEVELTNLVATFRSASTGTGLGIVGMQERAASVGAELVTSREGDRFQVRAVFAVSSGPPETGRSANLIEAVTETRSLP